MKYFLFIHLLAAAHACAGSVTAAPKERVPLSRIFDQARAGQPACFGREFSSEELAANPRQELRKIRVKAVSEKIEEATNQDHRYFDMELTLKGEKNFYRIYRVYLICDTKTESCAVECDGGDVRAWGGPDGTLEIQNRDFVIDEGCGEGRGRYLKAKPGADEHFSLVPLPKEYCQL
jgi:hypothetical protein